jgi:UDP-N-acetylglucosamine 4,6-dehydratase
MNGGEIFIPKIPSIKIVDLAKVINEKKPIKFIGLRPGEKLHEIMISKDDARLTEDRGNYYIIHPTINIWDRKRSMRKLKTVDDNFEYSSLTNKHWLQKKELTKIIKFIRNK